MYIKTQTHTHTPIQTQSDPFSDTHHGRRSRQQRLRHRFNSYIFFWFCCCFSVSTWNPIVCLSFPFTNLLFATSWLGYIQHETSLQPLVVAFVYSLGSTQASKAKKQFFKYFPLLLLLFLLLFYDSRRRCRTEKSLIHIKWICTDRPRFAKQQIFVARVVSSLL